MKKDLNQNAYVRRHREYKKIKEVHSIDSNSTHDNDVVTFFEVRDSLSSFDDYSLRLESSVSKGEVLYLSIYQHMTDDATRSNMQSIDTKPNTITFTKYINNGRGQLEPVLELLLYILFTA